MDLRVLVADDDPVCCESTCEIPTDMGMNSEWVLSGRAAVERVKTRHEQGRDFFTMIFSDIRMPNLDGCQAARRIRAMDRPWAKEIPIVAMSANAFTEDILNSKRAGMNDHITKPIDIDVLAKVLQTYIR